MTAGFTLAVACRPGSSEISNEDAYATLAAAVAVVDGTTSPGGLSTGCVHGTAWFSRSLARELVAAAGLALAGPAVARPGARRPGGGDLRTALESALAAIAARHRGSCDLTAPGTPSASVGLLVVRDDRVDYLVLSDVTILIESADELRVVTDDRCGRLLGALPERVLRTPSGSPERTEQLVRLVTIQRGLRNVPGGYWLAGAVPEAARHAIVGSVARSGIRGAALLTDGASRLVDLFRDLAWQSAIPALRNAGPRAWIDRVRCLEESDRDMIRWPRLKCSDDATVAVLTFP